MRNSPVIQEEATGCAIASAAAIAGLSYKQAKERANSLGIYANDPKLWSQTNYIRELLASLGYAAAHQELAFEEWDYLPDCALLAIKWHEHKGKAFWHWVVFKRGQGDAYVLDSKSGLKHNVRTDFGRMKPKWFIEVRPS